MAEITITQLSKDIFNGLNKKFQPVMLDEHTIGINEAGNPDKGFPLDPVLEIKRRDGSTVYTTPFGFYNDDFAFEPEKFGLGIREGYYVARNGKHLADKKQEELGVTKVEDIASIKCLIPDTREKEVLFRRELSLFDNNKVINDLDKYNVVNGYCEGLMKDIGMRGADPVEYAGGKRADDPDKKVAEWYRKTYPDDELGKQIDKSVTFRNIVDALNFDKDIYDVIGVGDSVVRENIFDQLEEAYGINYDLLYNKWMNPDCNPELHFSELVYYSKFPDEEQEIWHALYKTCSGNAPSSADDAFRNNQFQSAEEVHRNNIENVTYYMEYSGLKDVMLENIPGIEPYIKEALEERAKLIDMDELKKFPVEDYISDLKTAWAELEKGNKGFLDLTGADDITTEPWNNIAVRLGLGTYEVINKININLCSEEAQQNIAKKGPRDWAVELCKAGSAQFDDLIHKAEFLKDIKDMYSPGERQQTITDPVVGNLVEAADKAMEKEGRDAVLKVQLLPGKASLTIEAARFKDCFSKAKDAEELVTLERKDGMGRSLPVAEIAANVVSSVMSLVGENYYNRTEELSVYEDVSLMTQAAVEIGDKLVLLDLRDGGADYKIFGLDYMHAGGGFVDCEDLGGALEVIERDGKADGLMEKDAKPVIRTRDGGYKHAKEITDRLNIPVAMNDIEGYAEQLAAVVNEFTSCKANVEVYLDEIVITLHGDKTESEKFDTDITFVLEDNANIFQAASTADARLEGLLKEFRDAGAPEAVYEVREIQQAFYNLYEGTQMEGRKQAMLEANGLMPVRPNGQNR